MMMRISLPVETANPAIIDGSFAPTLQKFLAEIQPEAAYFVAENGVRGAYLFVNMTDSSQLPAFCEPVFLAHKAKVEMTPAMNIEDLKAAMPAVEQAVKKYAPAK
jgi:hypothetical protein